MQPNEPFCMKQELATERVWVIRTGAGKLKEAHSFFLEGNLVAIADYAIGDVSQLPSEKKCFIQRMKTLAHQSPAVTMPVGHLAGRFYAFVHEIRQGDIVIYPATKIDGRIWLGKVLSDYQYSESVRGNYPHQRAVDWLKQFPRSELRTDVLKEIGAFYPLFEVKRNPTFWVAQLQQ